MEWVGEVATKLALRMFPADRIYAAAFCQVKPSVIDGLKPTPPDCGVPPHSLEAIAISDAEGGRSVGQDTGMLAVKEHNDEEAKHERKSEHRPSLFEQAQFYNKTESTQCQRYA